MRKGFEKNGNQNREFKGVGFFERMFTATALTLSIAVIHHLTQNPNLTQNIETVNNNHISRLFGKE